MSVALDNLDFAEQIFEFIKQEDVELEDFIKEFGGISYYIPSFKTTMRNEKIIEEYKANWGKVKGLTKKLASKYELSEAQIFAITKEVRESPSLFNQ